MRTKYAIFTLVFLVLLWVLRTGYSNYIVAEALSHLKKPIESDMSIDTSPFYGKYEEVVNTIERTAWDNNIFHSSREDFDYSIGNYYARRAIAMEDSAPPEAVIYYVCLAYKYGAFSKDEFSRKMLSSIKKMQLEEIDPKQ